jgi:hypothetical protein
VLARVRGIDKEVSSTCTHVQISANRAASAAAMPTKGRTFYREAQKSPRLRQAAAGLLLWAREAGKSLVTRMRSPGWLLPSLPLLTLVVGCGHPASDKECQEIVERIATLELEKAGAPLDAKSVGAQIDETKKALAANTLKDCVGKRITERAMQCVRSAKTSAQIVDDCFK